MPRDGTITKQAVLDAVKAKPGNLDALVLKSGLAKTTVWRWITAMHEHPDPGQREVHVVKWEFPEQGGRPVGTFAAGPGEDVPCEIKPMSVAQRSKRHMKKAKKDGRWADRLARQRAVHWADRALKVRDPMIEALFGPPVKRQLRETA